MPPQPQKPIVHESIFPQNFSPALAAKTQTQLALSAGARFQLTRVQTAANPQAGQALVADWVPIPALSPATHKVARMIIASDSSGGSNYAFPLTPFMCDPSMLPQSPGGPLIGNNLLDNTGLVAQNNLGVQLSAQGTSPLIYLASDFEHGAIIPPRWFVRFTSRGALPGAGVIQTVTILYLLEG